MLIYGTFLWIVFFCGKTCKTFFVYEYSKRIKRCNHNINSQIKLKPIDKQRIVNIMRDYKISLIRNLTRIRCQKDTFPLSWIWRFNYPNSIRVFVHCFKQKGCFLRQNEGLWRKSIMFCPMFGQHSSHTIIHEIFMCNLTRLGKMIAFLILSHHFIDIWLEIIVPPE